MELTQSIFLQALEHDKYFEASQLYLARWQKLGQNHSERDIYKGFINGAAAFDMIEKGKYKAAKHVWKIYEKYRSLISEEQEHYKLFKNADRVLMKLRTKYKKIFDT
jgi:hypothetical protein